MSCVRCGQDKDIEKHHIIERLWGGGDEEENLEERCHPCHKYEHARRAIADALCRKYTLMRPTRLWLWQFRYDVLEALNSIEAIRGRGTYISYWVVEATHRTPKIVPS